MSILSSVIAGGAALAGQGINAWATGKTNKKTRKWNEKMYDRQLSDNMKMWTTQNEYNSPTAQMERLRAAGLNPNLVYGNGADNTAQPIQKSEVKPWSPEAPKFDLGQIVDSGLSAYNNFQVKDAQLNNLRSQNTIMDQEAALKAAQTASLVTKTSRDKLELEMASSLATTSMEFQRERLRKLQADTSFTLAENERKAALNTSSLQEAATRILQMREQTANTVEQRMLIQAQISNVINDTKLKDLDINLKRMGINPQDPMYARILGQLLGDAVNGITEPIKSLNLFKK